MALCDVNQEKLIVNSFKRFHNVLFFKAVIKQIDNCSIHLLEYKRNKVSIAWFENVKIFVKILSVI